VHFLQDLLDQGALTPDFGIRPTRAVRDAICPPTRSEVASRGCDLTPARWREIHRQHRADRLSIDEIARRQSLSRATVRAALNSNAQTCADEASPP
jgi:hypothetical protein